MNFADDFRNVELAKKLLAGIAKLAQQPVRIMEVCGGHTMAIRKSGIHTLLPGTVSLLSGPGCPVCVTSQNFIDLAVAHAMQPDTILLTYGDMLRVPGTSFSLDQAKAQGADVRLIYSTIDALDLARANPGKKIVFAAIGFETTVPGTAIAILEAARQNLKNFFIICAHKTMPAAMISLIEEGIPIDGYIGPGHVCAVAGSNIFSPMADRYHIPVVISGFEPLDLLQSIRMILLMLSEKQYGVQIQYSRLVKAEGNRKARTIIEKVFEPCAQHWRGIGEIPGSGLRLREEFSRFDAEQQLPVRVQTGPEPKGCICGQVLKGLKKPTSCRLFGRRCTPAEPVGACMVSSEGTCHAYFQFKS